MSHRPLIERMGERADQRGDPGPSSRSYGRAHRDYEYDTSRDRRRSASPVPSRTYSADRGEVPRGGGRGRGSPRRGRGDASGKHGAPGSDLDGGVRLDMVQIRHIPADMPDWQISMTFAKLGVIKQYSRNRVSRILSLQYVGMAPVDELMRRVGSDGYWHPDDWSKGPIQAHGPKYSGIPPKKWPAKLGIRRVGDAQPEFTRDPFPPYDKLDHLSRGSLTSDRPLLTAPLASRLGPKNDKSAQASKSVNQKSSVSLGRPRAGSASSEVREGPARPSKLPEPAQKSPVVEATIRPRKEPSNRPVPPAWGVSYIEWNDSFFLQYLGDSQFVKGLSAAVTSVASQYGTVTRVLLDKNSQGSRVIFQHPREAAAATLACSSNKLRGGFQPLGMRKMEVRFVRPQALIMPNAKKATQTTSIDGLEVAGSSNRTFKPTKGRASGDLGSIETALAPAATPSRFVKPVNALAARISGPSRRVFETTPATDLSWREGTAVPIVMPSDHVSEERRRAAEAVSVQHPAEALLSSAEHWSARPHQLLLYVDGEVEMPDEAEEDSQEETELLGTFDRYAENLRTLERQSGDDQSDEQRRSASPASDEQMPTVNRGSSRPERFLKVDYKTPSKDRRDDEQEGIRDSRLSSEDVELELATSPNVKDEPIWPQTSSDQPTSMSLDREVTSTAHGDHDDEAERFEPAHFKSVSKPAESQHSPVAGSAPITPEARSPSMPPPDAVMRVLPGHEDFDVLSPSRAKSGDARQLPATSSSSASPEAETQITLPPRAPQQQAEHAPTSPTLAVEASKITPARSPRHVADHAPMPSTPATAWHGLPGSASAAATPSPRAAKRARTSGTEPVGEPDTSTLCNDGSHAGILAKLVAERVRARELEQRLFNLELVGSVRNLAYAPFVKLHASHLDLEGREAYIAKLKERMEHAAHDLLQEH